ncbi:metal ABC transporter ATP-binding protein [Paenibacillus oryzisoli]|uniref:metal ABC transporter ATP-binding protein n=1 Tax=Paenibacillus oryzisoli TaxID=1850517 RepID=UPI003D2D4BBD
MLIASLHDVEFGYRDVPCIQQASLEIQSGEFVAVTGPNGAAKSTLLKLMLGLLKPWQGEVFLSSLNERGERLSVSYVSQQLAGFNSGFPSTVYEFVRSGRYRTGSWLRRLCKADDEVTEQAIRQVGLWELRKRRIGELSGGQKQRLCLARALVQDPDLLVLDEPTTGMDAGNRGGFYALMVDQIKNHGRTVVMVTHHLTEAAPHLDRIIELQRKEDGGWKCCTTTSCSGHFVPVG